MAEGMFAVISTCLVLLALTAVVHYEVLSTLNLRLPGLRIPPRSKLLVVILVAFFAHAIEIGLYGASFYLLDRIGIGTLGGPGGSSILNCLYFSAESYSTLGFGDLVPVGPIRLLAGVEALNGLLLLGWTASFTYISMERFWTHARP